MIHEQPNEIIFTTVAHELSSSNKLGYSVNAPKK